MYYFKCFRLWFTGMEISFLDPWRPWCSTWYRQKNIIPIEHTSLPFCWAQDSLSSPTSCLAKFVPYASISKTSMARAARWVQGLCSKLSARALSLHLCYSRQFKKKIYIFFFITLIDFYRSVYNVLYHDLFNYWLNGLKHFRMTSGMNE